MDDGSKKLVRGAFEEYKSYASFTFTCLTVFALVWTYYQTDVRSVVQSAIDSLEKAVDARFKSQDDKIASGDARTTRVVDLVNRNKEAEENHYQELNRDIKELLRRIPRPIADAK